MSFDSDSNEDLKAAAELAMEDQSCSLLTVAKTIREILGWRSARTAIDEARFALKLVGTERAIKIIDDYRLSRYPLSSEHNSLRTL